MITTGTKWFIGLGVATLMLAVAYGYTTGGNGLGPLSVGYKGGVGDHFGYGVLLIAAFISLAQGVLLEAWRDADPQAQAQVAHLDAVPAVRPVAVSYWPAIAAFGAGLVLVGLVYEPLLFIFGLIVLGIVLVEWTVQTWADNATGDPETNRRIRNRLMNPIEFPVGGALAVAVVIISFSRLFLATSKDGAVIGAAMLAALVLVGGWVLAARPKISANVVVGVLLVAAVAVIGLGVAGGIAGQRDYHKVAEEEGEHE
jgi:hypothetical protein